MQIAYSHGEISDPLLTAEIDFLNSCTAQYLRSADSQQKAAYPYTSGTACSGYHHCGLHHHSKYL